MRWFVRTMWKLLAGLPPRWPWATAGGLMLLALGALATRLEGLGPPTARRVLAAVDGGQIDEMQDLLEQFGHSARDSTLSEFLRGAVLLRQGRYYGALRCFGHAVDDPQLRVHTLLLSGEALYRLGQFRDAIGVLAQALEEDPDRPEIHLWLASAYYDLGLNPEARAHLLRAAELVPENPRPHRLLGLMDKDFEHYEEAVANYRESLRRSPVQPDTPQILLEMAECQIKLRAYAAALETLSRLPSSPDRWVKEAECLHAAGKPEEAKAKVEAALRQSPAHLSGLLLAGALALERGAVDEAVEWLGRAAVAYPREYLVRFRLAQALRRAGRTAEADRETAIAEELRQLRDEFSRLHQTAAAEPDNAEVRYRLGVLARKLGWPNLARVWFRAALGIDPRYEQARRELLQGGLGSFPSQTTKVSP